MGWLSDKTINHLRNVSAIPDLSQTQYACLDKIATGGMATVYLADDTRLHRRIALKVLSIPDPNGELAERMMQEAHIIAALEHPSIVPIHDVGTLPDGRVFYTMKLVKGWRLDEQIKRSDSLDDLLRMLQRVCEGVAFAHVHNVIHRDLKPENIMVGDFGEVLVMDWGLAKVLSGLKEDGRKDKAISPAAGIPKDRQSDHSAVRPIVERAGNITAHGAIMGTPAYMAPEQELGNIAAIDQRTDIYALGGILNFIMANKLADERKKLKSNRRRLLAYLYPRQKKHAKQLVAISAKAMALEKDERYRTALELRAEIESYLNGQPVTAYDENLLEVTLRWVKRNKFFVILICVYAFARLVMFFLLRS